MNPALFIFLLGIICTKAQTDLNVYATPYAGTELINLNKPNLAYASNLIFDPYHNVTPTLWFTADKSSPNIHKAQFNPKGGDHSFWASGQSPFGYEAAPFISVDVVGDNLIGVAYPNNYTQISIATLLVQSANILTDQVAGSYYSGYNFISVVIDRAVDPATNKSFVYVAGWGPSSFVVARGTVSLYGGDNSVSIDVASNVRSVESLLCYDLYDPIIKPKLYLTATYLLLAIPGRCASIFKFSLPDANSPFNSASVTPYVPPDLNVKYMSSSVFDSDHEVLYFIMQLYNDGGGHIFSINTATFTLKTGTTSLEISEGLALLVLGNEENSGKKFKYIFVAVSGSNQIIRYTVNDDFTLTSLSTAIIDSKINAISSALYIRPYFYYTTYEPDAKLVRITKNNFCGQFCGDNAFCDVGNCVCRDGYEVDITDPGRPCKLKDIVSNEVKARQGQGAAAALGVLFVFSLLAAIAGWFLWWKARNGEYKPIV